MELHLKRLLGSSWRGGGVPAGAELTESISAPADQDTLLIARSANKGPQFGERETALKIQLLVRGRGPDDGIQAVFGSPRRRAPPAPRRASRDSCGWQQDLPGGSAEQPRLPSAPWACLAARGDS